MLPEIVLFGLILINFLPPIVFPPIVLPPVENASNGAKELRGVVGGPGLRWGRPSPTTHVYDVFQFLNRRGPGLPRVPDAPPKVEETSSLGRRNFDLSRNEVER